jgi:hypothetical protein
MGRKKNRACKLTTPVGCDIGFREMKSLPAFLGSPQRLSEGQEEPRSDRVSHGIRIRIRP